MKNKEELFLPIKVYVYVTNYCHYKCDYCFLKEDGVLNTLHMSDETVKNILYYMKKYQVPLIAICGGDPFTYPKLHEFVQSLSNQKNYPMIATNAVDISFEYLSALKKAGIRYLQIGMDSISNNKKDNYKEDGHIKKVETSIKYLKEVGIKFGIATCITNQNVSRFDDIVDYCQKIGAESLKISLYKGENPLYALTKEQVSSLEKLIKEINYDKVYVRYALFKETVNYFSRFPDIRIYTNGDIGVDDTEIIGNINQRDPAHLYAEYLSKNY